MPIDRAPAFPGTLILKICLIRYLDLITSFPIPNIWGEGEMRKGNQLDLLFRSAGLSEGEANRAREAYEVQLEVCQNEQRNFARTLRNSAGFEQDDRTLGYVIGTGVGIALAYRLLLTCEIPRV